MLADAWRLAVGTLTALPVRPPAQVDARRAGWAMTLAPLAVLPLGVAAGVVAWAGHWLTLPPLVTALLIVAVVVLGNRAFHLDGLSDVADALAASYDRERSLQVMKSGTSGPAGVVAVVLVLGLQVAALADLVVTPCPGRVALLVLLAVCGSRVAIGWCCARGVPSARPDGLGATVAGTVSRASVAATIVLSAAALSGCAWWARLDWWRGLVAVAVAAVVVVLLLVRCTKRFGGVTGDVFGASVELALAALLVCLA